MAKGGYIGVNKEGIQAWKGQLEGAHHRVTEAIHHYRKIAAQSSEHAHGSHFDHINDQCEQIANKHLNEHHELHSQYTKASDKLVQGIIDVAGQ